MDHFGILTKFRDATDPEIEAYQSIQNLSQEYRAPYCKDGGEVVISAVREASMATLTVIMKQQHADQAIKKCSFLKHVSFHYLVHHKVASSNTSHLGANAGFFRLHRKVIFNPYLL